MKTRKEIQAKIKEEVYNLDYAIDTSVRTEKQSEESILAIRQKITDLKAEPCFEDTLAGRIFDLEKKADEKIIAIRTELEKQTGKEYYRKEEKKDKSELKNETYNYYKEYLKYLHNYSIPTKGR